MLQTRSEIAQILGVQEDSETVDNAISLGGPCRLIGRWRGTYASLGYRSIRSIRVAYPEFSHLALVGTDDNDLIAIYSEI